MKKILRRAIPLLLALLMILGTVAGALSTLVYAAPVLVFDDSFKGDAELSPKNWAAISTKLEPTP